VLVYAKETFLLENMLPECYMLTECICS